jgi:hypothetical protein
MANGRDGRDGRRAPETETAFAVATCPCGDGIAVGKENSQFTHGQAMSSQTNRDETSMQLRSPRSREMAGAGGVGRKHEGRPNRLSGEAATCPVPGMLGHRAPCSRSTECQLRPGASGVAPRVLASHPRHPRKRHKARRSCAGSLLNTSPPHHPRRNCPYVHVRRICPQPRP